MRKSKNKKLIRQLESRNKPDLTPSQNIPETSPNIIVRSKSIPSIKPVNFTNLVYGRDQKTPYAPLQVPAGFTTQVPYNTAINTTIIANPSPIPVSNYYSIMMSDPVVYSSMLYLVTSVMSKIGDYLNRENQKETDLINSTIQRIGKRKLLQGLLTSLWGGFASIRLNWDTIQFNTVIKNIQILPHNTILLAVTPDGELDKNFGVMQYYYNINSNWQQDPNAYGFGNAPLAAFGSKMTPDRQLTYNPMYISALPEDWYIHHVNNPTGLAGNYYGVSLIQSVYSDIVGKANQLNRLAIASTYKAAPMILFKTDTQTKVQTTTGSFISVAEDMSDVLPSAAAQGYLITEGLHSYEHFVVDNTADLDKMLNLVHFYNDQIRTGLITPNLVGNSGSYANAMANNFAHEEMITNIALHVKDTLENQLIPKIIKYGLDDIDKTDTIGSFEILDTSLENKTMWGKILEMSKNLGTISPNIDDYNFIRRKLGQPEVDKLTKDDLYNMAMASNTSKTNITGTKQDLNTPYAAGINDVKQDQYGGS